MKFLILDNGKKLFNSITHELDEARYEVHYASNGEEGLKVAQEKRFDLIVLDWALGKKGGLSVMKELKEQKISTPVLMLTA